MNIIDTHTHLPGTLWAPSPRPIAEVRQELEAAGVCRAWICTTDGLVANPRGNNDVLADTIAEHRDFFVPFCTVGPYEGVDTALSELDRAKNELGMRGLKLHPWLQAFSMTDPAVVPILERSAALGLPVLFHDGTPPYCTPLQIAAAAEKVPQATVVLGHSGLDDLTEDAILACLRHPNIYLSLTSLSSGRMAQVIDRCPTDRLLYGSDGGVCPHLARAGIQKLTATGAADEVLQKIFFDNPSRLLPPT